MNDKRLLIHNYIATQSRNKIVFYKDSINDISAVDVGTELSQAIYNMTDIKKLPMKISYELEKILNSSTVKLGDYGKSLAISNVGILFEPELKVDFSSLIEKHSKTNVLFIKWEGEIDNDNLYFLSKENGIKIDIKNLSHIVI
ncbi:MAG: hypothetical protein KA536_11430 [Saprospiraceae bacterium]|nr:hypothetical protein [Saprospiraceae bacterium]